MKKYKERPRLKNFGYEGYHRYFVTICTHERNHIFKNDAIVRQLIRVLKDMSNNLGFKVWAYCFMPDHLHLLVEGESPDSDLKKFISSYKQYTGYYYRDYVAQGFSPARTKHVAQDHNKHAAQGFSPARTKHVAQDHKKDVAQGFSPAQSPAQTKNPKLWQPSYYDHVLRKDEDILSVARYVVGNPVRKALVSHFADYEFIGSFELDMESLL